MSARQASGHEGYRAALETLAGPALDAPLADALAAAGLPPAAAGARRRGRFLPGQEPYARLVLAPAGGPPAVVEAFAAAPPPPPSVPAGAAGWLRARAGSDDPALPAVARLAAGDPPAAVVRLHPGLRCTLRTEADGSVRYAKVFADDTGRRVHGDELALQACAGGLGFAVAAPLAYDEAARTLWQAALPGVPVAARVAAADVELTVRIGRAAGTLSRAPLVFAWRAGVGDHVARVERHLAELAARVPAAAGDAEAVLAGVRALHAAAGEGSPVPVHGAPHAAQWLDDGGRLALVDFDRARLATAELDAAAFVADLDFEDPDRVPVEQLVAAFLGGFEESAGRLDARRLAAYRTGAHVAKALRAARAVRPDGDRRATRRLRRAARGLAEAA